MSQESLFGEFEPLTPYNGTSGWSGSVTSRERAETDDKTGVTAQRQLKVMAMLDDAGPDGLTWHEISEITGEHHGSVSGALSVLHKEHHIARLTERRGKCQIYVRHAYVQGRETVEHKSNIQNSRLHEWLTVLKQHLDNDRMLSAGAMVSEAIRNGI